MHWRKWKNTISFSMFGSFLIISRVRDKKDHFLFTQLINILRMFSRKLKNNFPKGLLLNKISFDGE